MDIVCALIGYGARVSAKSEDGCTPLHIAVKDGLSDIVSMLLENSASPKCYAKVSLIVPNG